MMGVWCVCGPRVVNNMYVCHVCVLRLPIHSNELLFFTYLFSERKDPPEDNTMVNQLKASRTRKNNSVLSRKEEKWLVVEIMGMIEACGNVEVTVADIKGICFEYCEEVKIRNNFDQTTRMASDDWYAGFEKRNYTLSYLKMKVRKKLSNVAKKSSSSTAVGSSSSSSLSHRNDKLLPQKKKLELKENPKVGEKVSVKLNKRMKNVDKHHMVLRSVRKGRKKDTVESKSRNVRNNKRRAVVVAETEVSFNLYSVLMFSF
jgi:hypothetical protein